MLGELRRVRRSFAPVMCAPVLAERPSQGRNSRREFIIEQVPY